MAPVMLIAWLSASLAAARFQRLTGAQIQARFSGMDLSDGVHWRDSYERGGTLKSHSMGKARSGTGKVDHNQLCIDLGRDSGGCYDVWLAGDKVEFRRDGLDGSILEGRLQKPLAAHPASGR